MQVQFSNDTDPLVWWKQHEQEFSRLARMAREYLTVTVPASPASPVSPERLFNSVGLVNSDLWGGLLDTTLIDVMWLNKHPKLNLKESKRKSAITHTHPDIHTAVTYFHDTRQYICKWHTPLIYVTDTHYSI